MILALIGLAVYAVLDSLSVAMSRRVVPILVRVAAFAMAFGASYLWAPDLWILTAVAAVGLVSILIDWINGQQPAPVTVAPTRRRVPDLP